MILFIEICYQFYLSKIKISFERMNRFLDFARNDGRIVTNRFLRFARLSELHDRIPGHMVTPWPGFSVLKTSNLIITFVNMKRQKRTVIHFELDDNITIMQFENLCNNWSKIVIGVSY